MKSLLVPIAGKSTRFPDTKPKWMLTHPESGYFMAIESIRGLNLDFFDKIYFIALKEHQNKYSFEQGFKQELTHLNLDNKTEIIYLNEQTNSQSETIYKALLKKDIKGFITIKDSDNFFESTFEDTKNKVSYYNLHKTTNINPSNKSYIQLDENNIITNIVEKTIISPTFSIGGYSFNSANDFIHSFESIKDIEGECYISNIIYDMMLKDQIFYGQVCNNYKDWGTLEDWNNYKTQYNTLFVDIDGTLVENTSYKFPPYIGNGKPLVNNIKWLRKLYNEGKTQIVLTTSRPQEYMQETIIELFEKEIPYDKLIMGLYHCKRIIINDYANSNPYPSCNSINIKRNSDTLDTYKI
tara:strand:+ start:135 stop:1193 length:1059 start_codon:yes stop_codon:yes gene_type:complete